MNDMIKEVNFNIYVDLDGVILDVSEKLYQIYKELMMEFGGSCLPKREYWQMKKTKTSIPEILKASGCGVEATQYLQKRNEKNRKL